jgi:hypothetical protein
MPNINQLAKALDEAEFEFRSAENEGVLYDEPQEEITRLREARENYFDALRKQWLDERQRLVGVVVFDDRGKGKRVGAAKFIRADGHRVDRLEKEMDSARERLTMLHDIGDNFYTVRELLEAEAAEERAEGRYQFFWEHWVQAYRDEKLIKAGKMKRPAAPRRAVSADGYIRDGYKMVDGKRVPVWEKLL